MFYELIIIGGGPAGITAGIYAARKKMKTLLLTEDFIGQVGKTGEIDNWPGNPKILGMDLMKRFEEHLKKFAAPSEQSLSAENKQDIEIYEGEKVVKVNRANKSEGVYSVSTESEKEFFAKTVIVATGRTPRQLNIPGEKEFIGRGVSFCSICDSPFFKDKTVVVVGGGNAGFGAALDLSKYAKRVFILERSKKTPADEVLQAQAKKEEKIEILLNKEVKKIAGRKKVEAVVYQDRLTKKTVRVPADGVFVQIGSTPSADFLKGLVKFNKRGEIMVNPLTCATSTPGIFAAGDVNENPWKQIATAVGDGCRAALAAYEYLQKEG